MSNVDLSNWLISQRSDFDKSDSLAHLNETNDKIAKIIAVASGKGGVGKTTASLMLAKSLAGEDKRVLVIDCDYNLSNTAVKLGLPISNNFYSLVTSEKSFDECLHKLDKVDLLTGCSGHAGLFEGKISHDKLIIDIISEHSKDYDYVLLDCPAGIGRETVNLAAYADERFLVVNPDRSSITDTYALIKILNTKYNINENHLLLNKISTNKQYTRVVKSLMDTVSTFLEGQLRVLGAIKYLDVPADEFDTSVFREEKSSIAKTFTKIVKKYADESTSLHQSEFLAGLKSPFEQEVQPNV